MVVVGIFILILSIAALVNQFLNLDYDNGNVIYVGGSGKGNFSSIKEAINKAESGVTIYIYDGIYQESNLTIDKEKIKIVGEGENQTIIDGFYKDNQKCRAVINVDANNVYLNGFTIINGDFGIRINGNDNVLENIEIKNLGTNNTNCLNELFGIAIYNSENNIISNSTINNSNGLILFDSNSNSIHKNNFTNNNIAFRIKGKSNNNLIYQNNFQNNTQNAYDNSTNLWFNENRGNFWDDYNGTDGNNDSIGDTAYIIQGGDNIDSYPLMKPYKKVRESTELIIDDFSLYTMLVIGMIVAIIFVLPIAYYWRKKYFS
jgi:nitrous oxidase accessory protein NosD